MANEITITVDLNDSASLARAAATFEALAVQNGAKINHTHDEKIVEIPSSTIDLDKEEQAQQVLEENGIVSPADETSAAQAFGGIEVPAAPANAELDSEGLPWDARIHSGNKTKLKGDGTWKLKRGVDEATVQAVKAELRALMAVPGAVVETPVPVVEQAPAPAPPVTETPAPTAEQTPPPAPPAELVVAASSTTFPELMARITRSGKDLNNEIMPVLIRHGIQSLQILAAHPDKIPAIEAELFPAGA